MDRTALLRMAFETHEALARGGYRNARGEEVALASMPAALAASRLLRPQEVAALAARAAGLPRGAPAVEITGETTLAAARRLVVAEGAARVAALNFASARRPGGGWDTGATAQEETLARASGLVPTLNRNEGFYRANNAERSLLYTDHVIVSPDVPVFRDDAGAWLEAPYPLTFVTAPAPNVHHMRPDDPDRGRAPAVLERRIRALLALCALEGWDVFVLGAWGCGAFGNDAGTVARLFADALRDPNTRFGSVRRLVFAVFDHRPGRPNEAAFRRGLAGAAPA